MTKLDNILKKLQNAKSAEEVFGRLSGVNTTEAEFKVVYRKFVAFTHPDRNRKQPGVASEAFILVEKWATEAFSKIKYKAYGIKRETPKQESVVLSSPKDKYVLDSVIAKGDLADIYRGLDGHGNLVVVKINRVPQNNDLLHNESINLRRINNSQAGKDKIGQHVVNLLDSFEINSQGKNCRVNVFPYHSDCFTLEQVLIKYPNGIPTRAMVWMFNRILAGLMVIHDNDVVHGAILPCHILINPKTHNGHILDFAYSSDVTRPIKAIVPKYKDFYPPEVFEKKTHFSTDLRMAAICMLQLILGNKPIIPNLKEALAKLHPRVAGMFRICLFNSPLKRPNDAYRFFLDFKEMLAEVFGPPQFFHFEM